VALDANEVFGAESTGLSKLIHDCGLYDLMDLQLLFTVALTGRWTTFWGQKDRFKVCAAAVRWLLMTVLCPIIEPCLLILTLTLSLEAKYPTLLLPLPVDSHPRTQRR
jgi:hypothetical protein